MGITAPFNAPRQKPAGSACAMLREDCRTSQVITTATTAQVSANRSQKIQREGRVAVTVAGMVNFLSQHGDPPPWDKYFLAGNVRH